MSKKLTIVPPPPDDPKSLKETPYAKYIDTQGETIWGFPAPALALLRKSTADKLRDARLAVLNRKKIKK